MISPPTGEKRPNTDLTGRAAPTSREEFAELARQAHGARGLLRALSHETRLLILCLLSKGEKTVSELETTLALPQAALAQQLARLRDDGLLTARREGRIACYRIADKEAATIVGTLLSLFSKPTWNKRD